MLISNFWSLFYNLFSNKAFYWFYLNLLINVISSNHLFWRSVNKNLLLNDFWNIFNI